MYRGSSLRILSALQRDELLEASSRRVQQAPGTIAAPDCFGFLFKLGARWHQWKKRYCVLKDACLFVYHDTDATQAIGKQVQQRPMLLLLSCIYCAVKLRLLQMFLNFVYVIKLRVLQLFFYCVYYLRLYISSLFQASCICTDTACKAPPSATRNTRLSYFLQNPNLGTFTSIATRSMTRKGKSWETITGILLIVLQYIDNSIICKGKLWENQHTEK